MRIVADTNTVLSGLLWQGPPRRLLDLARERKVSLYTSVTLLAELAEVIARDKFAERVRAAGLSATELVQDYERLAEVVTPEPLPAPHSVPHPNTLLRMDGDGLSENPPFDGFPAAPCAPKMPPPGFQGRFVRARINPRIWRSWSRPSDRHRLTDLDRPVCQRPRTSKSEMCRYRLCCRSSITASQPRSHRRVPRRDRPYAAGGRKPPKSQRPRARACNRAPVDSRAP